MADKPRVSKPRVKAPKQRTTPDPKAADERRRMLMYGGVGLAALAVVVLIVALLGLGGGGPSPGEVRADLQAAGCALVVAPALPGAHSVAEPGATSAKWNTNPPTNGPHYGEAAIFGIYEDEVELARLVHNLEHGGVYILYGNRVPDSTVEQLRSFYEDHKTGTIMAPLSRLSDKFALGAWVADGDVDSGYLAKCKTFDEEAVSAFFRAFQFKGPERFDPSDLQPGR